MFMMLVLCLIRYKRTCGGMFDVSNVMCVLLGDSRQIADQRSIELLNWCGNWLDLIAGHYCVWRVSVESIHSALQSLNKPDGGLHVVAFDQSHLTFHYCVSLFHNFPVVNCCYDLIISWIKQERNSDDLMRSLAPRTHPRSVARSLVRSGECRIVLWCSASSIQPLEPVAVAIQADLFCEHAIDATVDSNWSVKFSYCNTYLLLSNLLVSRNNSSTSVLRRSMIRPKQTSSMGESKSSVSKSFVVMLWL